MSGDKDEVIAALRRELSEMQHDMFGFQESGWALLDHAGADITHIFAQRLARRISDLGALLS